MTYCLWGKPRDAGGNAIAEMDDPNEMRGLVRWLLDHDWEADELLLLLPDGEHALEPNELLAWLATP